MNADEYKREIYKEAGVLDVALKGARALAKSKVGTKTVSAAKNFGKAGLGGKMARGGAAGATVGAATSKYDPAQDDGTFGKGRLGQALKGAASGAVTGAAVGAAAHGVTKGAKNIADGIKTPTAKTVSSKAPAGTASATVTKKPDFGPSDGFAARNTTGLTLEQQMKRRGVKTTGNVNTINSIPITSVAGEEIDRLVMEKVAVDLGAKIKELLERIKKLPKEFVNADPEIRTFIGAIAGAGIASLTFPKLEKVEKALAELEKKFGGKIPLSKATGRGASAIAGASAGALAGYVFGNKKFGQQEKSASERLIEILK